MKNTVCFFALLSLLMTVLFGQEQTVWSCKSAAELAANGIAPVASAGHLCVAEVPAGENAPDGSQVLAFRVKTPQGATNHFAKQINFLYQRPISEGQRYRISFYYKGSCPGTVIYSPAYHYAPYTDVAPRAATTLQVTTQWQRAVLEFTTHRGGLPPFSMPRFRLGTFPDGGVFYLGKVTLERMDKYYASTLGPKWHYTLDGSAPVDALPASEQLELVENFIDLGKRFPELNPNKRIILFQKFQAPTDGTMTLGMGADWWMECFVNGKPVYDTLKNGNLTQSFTPKDHIFNVPVRQGENLIAVRIRPGSAGCKFANGTVPVMDGDPKLLRLFRPVAGKNLRPVNTEHFLEVKPGTALDFSQLVPRHAPAGAQGRLIVGKTGNGEFAGEPGKPARFFGFNLALGSMMWEDRLHEWDHAKIDRLCDAIYRRGYNYVRIQVPEAFFIGFKVFREYFNADYRQVPIPQTMQELEDTIDKGNLERFDYLMAGLKRRGIYVSLDMAGSRMIRKLWRVPRNHSFFSHLFFDPIYRNHWKLYVEYIMGRKNPYTGVAYKDEAQIVMVNYINEQDLRFANGLDFLTPLFRDYLRKKYRTDQELAKAWAMPVTIDGVPAIAEAHLHRQDQRSRDTGDFLIHTMAEMSTWFYNTLAASGYPGLSYHWDMILRTLEFPGRALLPAASHHTYFAHPHAVPSQKLVEKKNRSANAAASNYPNDSTVFQGSSLDSSYFRASAVARFLDRPYFITEYSHSGLNRYRHERGLYFASYASLQEWSALAAHCRTVRLIRLPLGWFDDANDPISRANEALTALIYLRRDVQPAPHSVALELQSAKMFPQHYLAAIGDEYAKMAFVTRVGILYPEVTPLAKVGSAQPDVRFVPQGFSGLSVGQWFISADTSNSGKEVPFFLELRQKGILSADNPTDSRRKFYVSETGELQLDAQAGTMKVITPRLEGAILKSTAPMELKHLHIHSSSRPATVALAALDGQKDLQQSRRMLLIYSTNAFNSGSVYDTEDLRVLLDSGDAPQLIESGVLECSFTYNHNQLPQIWALNFDGTRAQQIGTVTRKDGKLHLRLDTSTLRHGTLFFEIIHPEN